MIDRRTHPGGAEKHAVGLLNSFDVDRYGLHLWYFEPEEQLLPQVSGEKLVHHACLHRRRRIDWRCAKAMASYVKENDIDIIVCINEYPMVYGYLARILSKHKCRLVEILHSTQPKSMYERVKRLLYRGLLRRFDRIVFVSENQRRYWMKTANLRQQKTIVIQNGIDPGTFHPSQTPEERIRVRRELGLTPEDYVVGTCSALRREKRHVDFLEAIEKVRGRGISIKGLMIGAGPQQVALERRMRERQMADIVTITGFQDDVRPFLEICDCLVMTSITETFSIAVLEAMAFGKPVISSRTSGAAEQIEHGKTGLLFALRDTVGLAEHIVTLSEATVREAMGRAALQKFLREFTHVKMVERYDRLLDDLT